MCALKDVGCPYINDISPYVGNDFQVLGAVLREEDSALSIGAGGVQNHG